MYAITSEQNCSMDLSSLINATRRGRGRGRWRGRGHSWRGNRNNFRTFNKSKEEIKPDLIEPNKVFIANLDRTVTTKELGQFLTQYGDIVEINVIRKNPNNTSCRPYGFVKFATEMDTQRILNLRGRDLNFRGNQIVIKPAKRQFKLPGSVGFERTPFDDRAFNLDPVDLDLVCAHILIDDVLLRIFDFLPLKDLIRMERVCRRWQYLVHLCFRKKACVEIQGDISLWLEKNSISPSFPAISKVLILCGEPLKQLMVTEFGRLSNSKLIRAIAQLCPSLESLTLSSVGKINNTYLKELVFSCPNLKSFKISDRSGFNESNLSLLFSSLPYLEVLNLKSAEVSGKCFDILPKSLKELHISKCHFVRSPCLNHIPIRCSELEVLNLEGVSIHGTTLTEIGKMCPNIRVLIVEVEGMKVEVDFTNFKNIKKLNYLGCLYSVNKLIKSMPQLEELKVDGVMIEDVNDVIDFSQLTNLRSLNLACNAKVNFSSASLKTISYCSKLETLQFKGNNEHKNIMLDYIRKCASLRELDCPLITLSEHDIDSFVEANKNRPHRLKFVIGLDQSALEQIEKLNDANYDVDMFDAHNLFSDFEYYEDNMDDLYYDSDSMDSNDDIDFYFQNEYGFDYESDYEYLHYLVDPIGLFFLDSD